MSQLLITTPLRAHPVAAPASDVASVPSVRIMGVDFAAIREQEVVEAFVDGAVAGLGRWVVTANLDHLRRYTNEPETRELIGEADIVVADGTPIVFASRIAGMPLPERVTGSSMIVPISQRAAVMGASIYLLGGEAGVAERAQAVLEETAPGLRVVGTSCPPHGFEHDHALLEEIEQTLLETSPDIVLLALSFPKTDALIRRLRPLMPSASYMGVGIALSFVAGDKRRAPVWMRVAGIEWLHRLMSEPTRLWRRYLLHGMPFAARLGAAAMAARVRRGAHFTREDGAARRSFGTSKA